MVPDFIALKIQKIIFWWQVAVTAMQEQNQINLMDGVGFQASRGGGGVKSKEFINKQKLEEMQLWYYQENSYHIQSKFIKNR
jgi:hypothetical protein